MARGSWFSVVGTVLDKFVMPPVYYLVSSAVLHFSAKKKEKKGRNLLVFFL
jgi:hypothetical protein